MIRLYGILRCLFRPCAWVEHSRREEHFSGARFVTWKCRWCGSEWEVRAGGRGNGTADKRGSSQIAQHLR